MIINCLLVKKTGGFTLIEILVALVILMVGLLGIAALQSKAQQAQLESYQRNQALIILGDMVNRIKLNRAAAGCYALTAAETGSPYAGVGSDSSKFDCTAYGTIDSQAWAKADLELWDALLKGASEVRDGVNIGAMIGSRGCIVSTATDVYQVTVAWQGLYDTTVPANNCATGQYGGNAGEPRRRVVSVTLQIPDLN